jgi:WD40 repeat protein
VRPAADLRTIREVVALSASTVTLAPAQFAGQLLGRLLDVEGAGVEHLVEQARRWDGGPWLAPLGASLSPPGGPLRLTISAHVGAGGGPMGSIDALAVSEDGAVAISAGVDGHVRCWDLASGDRLWEYEVPEVPVQRLAIAQGSAIVAAYFESGRVRTWDLATGALRAEAAFGEDAAAIRHAAKESRTVIWEYELRGNVNAVALSGDEPCALVARDGEPWLSCAHRHRSEPLGIRGLGPVALGPECRRAAVAVGSDLWVWDADTRSATGPLLGHGDGILCVAVSPDGRRAVTGSRDKTVILWDLETCTILSTLIGHSGFVLDVSVGIGERGSRAVSTSTDRTVIVWDLETGTKIGVIEGPVSFPRAVVSADARTVVTTTAEGMLRVWDLERWEESAVGEGTVDLVHLASTDPAGDRCVVTAHIDTIRRWDVEGYVRAGTPIGQSGIFGVWALGITPDGRTAALAGSTAELELWDLDDAGLMRKTPLPHQRVKSLAVTSDGKWIVTVTEGSVVVSDLATGETLSRNMVEGVDSVYAAEADDHLLVGGQLGSGGRFLAAFDLETGKVSPVLLAKSEGVAILPSRDGRYAVVTGGSEGLVLAELGGARRQVVLDAALITPVAIAVQSDSRLIGVGRIDLETAGVAVWDIDSGDVIGDAAFKGDARPLPLMEVSLDGMRVVVIENGGRTHFLELRGFPHHADTWGRGDHSETCEPF